MRIAGMGFRKDAPVASLRAVLAAVEQVGGAATALATVPGKAGAPALQRLAAERGLAVLAVVVKGVETATRSARVQALHGTGSLAEAAALMAAGTGAALTVARMTAPDGMATCAMAASPAAMSAASPAAIPAAVSESPR